MRISDWSSDVCSSDLGLVRRTRLGNFRNAMPRGPAKDDQIDERIRTKAIRAMNRNTSRFTDSKQAGHDCVRIAVPQRHDFTMIIGWEIGRASGRERVSEKV